MRDLARQIQSVYSRWLFFSDNATSADVSNFVAVALILSGAPFYDLVTGCYCCYSAPVIKSSYHVYIYIYVYVLRRSWKMSMVFRL